MSKASEWKITLESRPKIIVNFIDEDVPHNCAGSGMVNTLEVSAMGNLAFHQARTLMQRCPNKYGVYSAPDMVFYRPAEALRLADWIYETFGFGEEP